MAERHFTPLDSPLEVELSGTRLIEAGAGTGKTWTIAALVLRLLLERQLDIGQILVVTYTRAATGELRGRIRARLVDALAAFSTGTASEPYLLALVERFQAEPACARLRLAIESFDEATIHTIHGFCQRALAETAFAAAQPFERELITDQSELLAAVARDAWRCALAGASLPWAGWLIDRFGGPEGLVARVRSHLGRVDARLAAPPLAERVLAEASLRVAHAAARSLWLAQAQALRNWVDAARLKKNIYSLAKIDAAFACAERLFAGDDPVFPLPEELLFLGSAKLAQGRSKDSPPMEHPFFTAVDTLLAAAAGLARVYDQATRGLLHDFLLTARRDLAAAKRRSGQQAYDDLLADLAAALRSASGPALAASLRDRYRVALVDEFQDTDPQQLEIFSTVFGRADDLLVFVGDPKQAIYGFRGADVFAYLAARGRADAGYALLKNRRSVPPLLTAVNRLFDRPLPFLLAGLPFEPAQPAEMEHEDCTIDDGQAPLSLWTLAVPADKKGFAKELARDRAAAAVGDDIARLLLLVREGRARLDDRPLGGGDIAVLVRTHRQGEAVKAALAVRSIASVSLGGGSVWQSEEAEEIERVMLAIAAPSRGGLVRAALTTLLMGRSAVDLIEGAEGSSAWANWLENFQADQALLRERGFMAMWRQLLRREGAIARLLARPDGERRLTNYRHLAELLQVAEREAALDAEGLARHLLHRRETPAGEESQLRLESDADLVRIVTLHAAKGLEYAIVYCPFLWEGPQVDTDRWPVLAHPPSLAHACLDFGSADIDALRDAADLEEAAEELRLAYVALTRARQRCVVIWAKANQCERSPLAWLLFGPQAAIAGEPRAWLADRLAHLDEAGLAGELAALAASTGGAMAVLPAAQRPFGPTVADDSPAATWAPRRLAATIPAPWRVRSFSSLAARLDLEAPPDRDASPATGAVPPAPTFSGIYAFPRGTRAGSCLHALFERIDFRTLANLGPLAAEVLQSFGYDARWQPVLEKLVADVVATPLDESGLTLAQIGRGVRLDELEFLFPLDSAAGREGYMKGFIDLVFRHGGRWYIVDYKSNWLGETRDDYAAPQLAAAMRQHRYDLQLRIYAAALKRLLAWREPQLDWDTGFGGVFYLFLRGMGPDFGQGVVFVRPGADEIAEWLP